MKTVFRIPEYNDMDLWPTDLEHKRIPLLSKSIHHVNLKTVGEMESTYCTLCHIRQDRMSFGQTARATDRLTCENFVSLGLLYSKTQKIFSFLSGMYYLTP